MTEILKVKGDWQEVVDDCRSTVGKEALGHEPSSEFKRSILIAECSQSSRTCWYPIVCTGAAARRSTAVGSTGRCACETPLRVARTSKSVTPCTTDRAAQL